MEEIVRRVFIADDLNAYDLQYSFEQQPACLGDVQTRLYKKILNSLKNTSNPDELITNLDLLKTSMLSPSEEQKVLFSNLKKAAISSSTEIKEMVAQSLPRNHDTRTEAEKLSELTKALNKNKRSGQNTTRLEKAIGSFGQILSGINSNPPSPDQITNVRKYYSLLISDQNDPKASSEIYKFIKSKLPSPLKEQLSVEGKELETQIGQIFHINESPKIIIAPEQITEPTIKKEGVFTRIADWFKNIKNKIQQSFTKKQSNKLYGLDTVPIHLLDAPDVSKQTKNQTQTTEKFTNYQQKTREGKSDQRTFP